MNPSYVNLLSQVGAGPLSAAEATYAGTEAPFM